MSAEQWGLVIQTELVKIWVDSMTAIEQDKYAGACDEQGRLNLDRVPADVYASLDEAILHQAEALGWRITLSELVRFRFSAWEQDPDGPELFKKLGMAMRRSALIMQKRELPPIEDPDQWPVKKETVEELRLVLERLRAAFAPRRSVIGVIDTSDVLDIPPLSMSQHFSAPQSLRYRINRSFSWR